MFDEEDVERVTRKLPRLIRIIFYALRLTNAEFDDRYWSYWQRELPTRDRKDFTQQKSANRNAVSNEKSLTFKLFEHILYVMGYNIKAITVELEDQETGKLLTFSTKQTSEELKEMVSQEKPIGIQSIFG